MSVYFELGQDGPAYAELKHILQANPASHRAWLVGIAPLLLLSGHVGKVLIEIHLGRAELKKCDVASRHALELCTRTGERITVLRVLQRIAQASKNASLEKEVCIRVLLPVVSHPWPRSRPSCVHCETKPHGPTT